MSLLSPPRDSMVKIEIGTVPTSIEPGEITFREIRFGSDPGLPLSPVTLEFNRAEFVEKLEPLYENWIREERDGGQPSEELSYLRELEFPNLNEFLNHPEYASDFFCKYVPVDTLFHALGSDKDGISIWVINDLQSLSISSDTVTLTGHAFEKSSTPVKQAEQPKIFLSDSDAVAAGFSVLGAAHAALAWRLRYQDTPYELRQYKPSDFVWVSSAEFSSLALGHESVQITESKLDHRPVALVVGNQPKEASDTSISNPASTAHLKMYILLEKGLSLDEAITAAANGAVGCYNTFQTNPLMQQWVHGTFHKVVCELSSEELAKAKAAGDFVEIKSPLDSAVVGLAFCPREEWSNSFKHYRMYKGPQAD